MNKSAPKPLFHPRLLDVFSGKISDFSWSTEILSGLTVGLIALPLALALGIASIPQGSITPFPAPAIGIFTAIIAGAIIAGFGGSRVQIGGPTAAFIPIVLMIIQEHGYSGLLVATLMAGVILIFMGLTRMGTLIKYIPWPVTSGFTTGIAISIMLSQVPDFLGLRITEASPHEFFEKMMWLGRHASSLNPITAVLGVLSVGIILFWPRLKFKRIPGSIVAMLIASLCVGISGWGNTQDVATIASKFGADALAVSFPSPHLPHIEWAMVHDLLGPATAIALLGAIESLLSAVVADGLSGDRHDSNTELIAQGIANLTCPFFGGLPATGAIARTTANINSGAKTPISGIVHALTLLLLILVGAKLAGKIPMTAMSAVLVVVAIRMGDWHELKRCHKMPRSDALVLLTTFGLTVVFDLVIAIQVGMVLAAMLYIRRVSETTEVSQVTDQDMLERPEHLAQGKSIPEGVQVFRIFGPFMFGAAEKMEAALEASGELPPVLILRLHLVTAMDATGLNALESLVERMMDHKKKVILSGVHLQPLSMMRKSGFVDQLGFENFTATFDDALLLAEELLKKT
ncbi:SulP family inorganic anion transporter [Kiritimatiellota bacterium B12222]|nr:SulP family inorganic anion transporter [Kiritimatiellota bacterium B12222]